MFANFRRQDIVITAVTVLLAVLSLLLIYSTTLNASNPQEGTGAVSRQLLFFIVGFGFYFALCALDLRWIQQRNVVIAVAAATIFFLLLVLIQPETRANTLRWLNLGPFSFQPAEFAKLTIVLVSSYLFTQRQYLLATERHQHAGRPALLMSGLFTLLICALVFLERSLGNTLIAFTVYLLVLAAAVNYNRKQLIIAALTVLAILSFFQVGVFADIAHSSYLGPDGWKLFSSGLLLVSYLFLWRLFDFPKYLLVGSLIVCFLLAPVSSFAWDNLLAPYQRQRVTSFLQPEADLAGSSYQVRQSLIAIGSGQFWGRGYLQGTQSNLKVLPFAHTDFIFAALAEQFGFIGVLILFLLYGILCWRGLQLAMNIENQFAKLICYGVLAILVLNIFINTGMNLGLMPVTGVPLPLVSYGGSAVLLNLICLGVMQSCNSALRFSAQAEKFRFLKQTVV